MERTPDSNLGARPAGWASPSFAHPREPELAGASLGELVGRLTQDLSTLMRQEVELARAEISAEASKAGKGAGMLGGAGIAGLFVAMMLSLAAAWGLAAAIPAGWAFLIVGLIWAALAGVMFVNGRKEIRRVRPVPEKTVQTLKEDAQWAKHPTS